ncbi:MAG: hypothetical protein JSU04_06110 [Bdellovibrionales bacterium]|nr:hypothetical protein [Bdellovibrionales bacterium]
MKLAIDSLPLKKSLSQSTDYSGIQFFSLSHSALAESEITEVNSLTYECRLPSTMQWDDGSPVTGSDFLLGFKHLFAEKPLLRQLLFKDLKMMECKDDKIRFFLKKKNSFFSEILKMPFLTPAQSQLRGSSGAYRLDSQNEDQFLFSKQRSVPGPQEILLRHIQSPEDNMKAFLLGEIDITSDTALPLHLDFQGLPVQRHETGLFAGFEMSRRFYDLTSLDSRKSLQNLISSVSFEHIHFGKYDSWTLPSESNGKIEPCSIKIAFDPFYPNKEICTAVQEKLTAKGFKVELAVDDYYQPYQEYDLKFIIRRGLGAHPYFRYLSLIKEPGIYDNKATLKSLARVYDSWERAEIDDAGAIYLCDHLLEDAASFIPLFKIPSLSLNRTLSENPLLKFLK